MKRKDRNHYARSFLFYFMLVFFFAPGVAQEDRMEYLCPPCGHDCLNTIFTSPGACGECGMQLEEKSIVQQRLANATTTQPPAQERTKVAILLFEGVQIIDYTGPYEVFGGAGFDVYTVAKTEEPIRTVYGMQVTPEYPLDSAPQPDIVLVPGGQVMTTQNDEIIKEWLREVAQQADIVLSVCNGAFILAKAGLLEGLSATTTRRLVDGLASAAPNINVVHGTRFVDNGKIITSGGLSAGIDAALHVVSRLQGTERARNLAEGLEYDWRSEGTVVKD